MSIFTRDQLLHLRESPLVAAINPELPPWISSEAIEKAQKEPRVATRIAGPVTTKPGETADNDGFILREPRSKRDSRDKDTRGSADRLFERRNPLSKEDRGFDKNDVFKSLREPRRPEAGEENFASRRGLKKAAAQSTRESREAPAWAQEKKANAHASAAAEAGKDEDNDPSGKTIDDFERWKASMRKAEGLEAGAQASETVLPPLQQAASSPAKEVKAPPGFTPAMASTEDGEALMNKLFAAGGASSIQPSPEKQHKASPPGHSSVAAGGSSKFSKFFSAAGPTPAARQEARPQQVVQQQPDALAAFAEASSGKPKNKDDVEGLERILAMLSSSQGQQKSGPPASQHQGGQRQHHEPTGGSGDVYASRGNNPSQPLRGQGFPGPAAHAPYLQYPDRNAMLGMQPGDVNMLPPRTHPTSPQKDRNSRGIVAFSPEHEHLRYAQQTQPPNMVGGYGGPPSHRQQGPPMGMHGPMGPLVPPPPMSMPAMRDGSGGVDGILGHHAQNQDFFSSLLSQAGPLPPHHHHQQQQQQQHHSFHQQQQHQVGGGPTSPVNAMAGLAGRPPQTREEAAYVQQRMREQAMANGSRRYEGGEGGAGLPQGQAWSLDPRMPPSSSGPSQPYR
ncbi:hypothetical protein BCR37DRAFT_382478 [Protomyces lactucae-debilis]|uniref:Uncharacterized protein n=1 Tax=Protomyces lactucae-debilis TaxID=2754530 RepID=A0A1Y2F4F2_PROLT|nr:uncharacterized protein BCR37DRAFT_382478 [Protomyces lactucae-debilis]ORY78206.1 hypothetical protein BCR37DRAFT_382478 [Protomyces lactucae-debilis]